MGAMKLSQPHFTAQIVTQTRKPSRSSSRHDRPSLADCIPPVPG